MNIDNLTVRQKILLAACDLGPESFHAHKLVVRVWERWPETFSLHGCDRRHPNSNAVLAKLSGADGLVALGWFVPTGTPSTFAVTTLGRRAATELASPRVPRSVASRVTSKAPVPPRPPKPRPGRAGPRTSTSPAMPSAANGSASLPPQPLDVLLASTLAKGEALRKFLRGSPLTFGDACGFWGISPDHLDSAPRRLDDIGERLERVVAAFSQGNVATDGFPTPGTCYGLLNLHRLMRNRFAKELAPRPGTDVAHD